MSSENQQCADEAAIRDEIETCALEIYDRLSRLVELRADLPVIAAETLLNWSAAAALLDEPSTPPMSNNVISATCGVL